MHRWKYNVTINLGGMRCLVMDWIQPAKNSQIECFRGHSSELFEFHKSGELLNRMNYYKFHKEHSAPCSDGSVGIALGYGLDDRGSRVRFPAGAGNFSIHHCVQNGSGAHPASYPM
jgi:hypothetical protein